MTSFSARSHAHTGCTNCCLISGDFQTKAGPSPGQP